MLEMGVMGSIYSNLIHSRVEVHLTVWQYNQKCLAGRIPIVHWKKIQLNNHKTQSSKCSLAYFV